MTLLEHAHDLESLKRGEGGFHRLEAKGGFDQALELAVIRLDNIVEVFDRAVSNRLRLLSLRIDLGKSDAIGRVLVGREGMRLSPFRRGAQRLFQKARGGADVAGVGQIEFNGSAARANRAIQIFPFSFDLDVGFVNALGAVVIAALPIPAQPLFDLRRVGLNPTIQRRMVNLDAALCHHLF